MSSYNSRESAEWALAVDEMGGKLVDGVGKFLSDSAARGFPAPPGDTLADILAVAKGIKGKLADVNGKVYDERRGVLFQQQEFLLNAMVKAVKLGMELYREEIFNALAIEQAQVDAARDTNRAYVERFNASTELRQRAIIQNRAEAERQVIVYKQQLVEAQTTTLKADRILIQAQLTTAEKKLEIIDSIYQVLAAEEMVVAADQHRVVALQKLLEAEFALIGIKEAMVPYYLAKAAAEEVLAGAITAELPVTEALVRLGYDRIDLKTTEEYAGHLTRAQEEVLELLRQAYVRAHTAYELVQHQNRRLLQEYKNAIQSAIQDIRIPLDPEKEWGWERIKESIGLQQNLLEIILKDKFRAIDILDEDSRFGKEMVDIMNQMEIRGVSLANTIMAQTSKNITSNTKRNNTRSYLNADALYRYIVIGA